jgi:UDPglucose 6-dehydrogenase
MIRICMIGTGYVGLVSGACLADFGNSVYCIDIDKKRIDALKKGKIPIYEPGLEHMVERNVEAGRLQFDTDLRLAVKDSDVVFIAVGTPSRPDGSTDLKQVFSASENLAVHLNGYKVIVQKSTVPVGVTREIARRIRAKTAPGATFDIVSNPEFLREGSAIEDFLRPNRVIIGVESKKAEDIMKRIYRPLYLIETPIVFTTLETAELTKYASNAFLATKISFINEIAAICDLAGANIDDVARGMGLDKRIGSKFLHAGLGYGGSCLPKDVSSLIHVAKSHNYDPLIIRAAHELNRSLIDKAIEKIKSEIAPVEGKTIGILGLSFKPNTDDLREAPAIKLIDKLLALKAKLKVFDPVAMNNFKALGYKVEYCKNPYDVAEDCNALILVTEWNEFRELDLNRIKKMMVNPVFLDCRNVYKRALMLEHGFRYQSFGRGVLKESSDD